MVIFSDYQVIIKLQVRIWYLSNMHQLKSVQMVSVSRSRLLTDAETDDGSSGKEGKELNSHWKHKFPLVISSKDCSMNRQTAGLPGVVNFSCTKHVPASETQKLKYTVC